MPSTLGPTGAPDMTVRILVVENEESLKLMLRYNLEAEGYVVETIDRGDAADFKLRENKFDLLVTEWSLPGLSGIELIRRLRVRAETQALPIIMVTARGEETERARGLATGADDYIVKPVSVPKLLQRVRALLQRTYSAEDLQFGRGRWTPEGWSESDS
jgi:two-component system phosphate regulon response regulator PhoB